MRNQKSSRESGNGVSQQAQSQVPEDPSDGELPRHTLTAFQPDGCSWTTGSGHKVGGPIPEGDDD